jgi:hypothetical protein
MEILSYEPAAECAGCDKQTECLVIQTEAWTAPQCAKCLMREMKKRQNGARHQAEAQ